jgi:hypothetical protein
MALLAASRIAPYWSVLITAIGTRMDSFLPCIHLWPAPWSVEGVRILFSSVDFRLAVANRLSDPKAPDCVIDLGLFDSEARPFHGQTGFCGGSGGTGRATAARSRACVLNLGRLQKKVMALCRGSFGLSQAVFKPA